MCLRRHWSICSFESFLDLKSQISNDRRSEIWDLRLRLKIPYVLKRFLIVRKIRPVVKSRAIVLLHPPFGYAYFVERRHRLYPLTFADASRKQGVAWVRARHVSRIVLGHQ